MVRALICSVGTLEMLMSGKASMSLAMGRREKNSSLTFTKVDIYASDSETEGTGAERSQRILASVFTDHPHWVLPGVMMSNKAGKTEKYINRKRSAHL